MYDEKICTQYPQFLQMSQYRARLSVALTRGAEKLPLAERIAMIPPPRPLWQNRSNPKVNYCSCCFHFCILVFFLPKHLTVLATLCTSMPLTSTHGSIERRMRVYLHKDGYRSILPTCAREQSMTSATSQSINQRHTGRHLPQALKKKLQKTASSRLPWNKSLKCVAVIYKI